MHAFCLDLLEALEILLPAPLNFPFLFLFFATFLRNLERIEDAGSFVDTLVTHWEHIGDAMGTHWERVGDALGTH